VRIVCTGWRTKLNWNWDQSVEDLVWGGTEKITGGRLTKLRLYATVYWDFQNTGWYWQNNLPNYTINLLLRLFDFFLNLPFAIWPHDAFKSNSNKLADLSQALAQVSFPAEADLNLTVEFQIWVSIEKTYNYTLLISSY
jgi:hypothetical protein